MRNLRLACLSLTLLAACTTPYKPPVAVEEPGGQPARAFDGIAASLSSERKTRVFWTHGMRRAASSRSPISSGLR